MAVRRKYGDSRFDRELASIMSETRIGKMAVGLPKTSHKPKRYRSYQKPGPDSGFDLMPVSYDAPTAHVPKRRKRSLPKPRRSQLM